MVLTCQAKSLITYRPSYVCIPVRKEHRVGMMKKVLAGSVRNMAIPCGVDAVNDVAHSIISPPPGAVSQKRNFTVASQIIR